MFLAPNDPRLKQACSACSLPSDEIQDLIETMFDVAYGNTLKEGDARKFQRPILVGLAAPQIGVMKRVILVDTAATGVFTEEAREVLAPQLDAFINPEILWQSEEQIIWREGCFSTSRLCGLVPRSSKVIVKAYDRKGHIIVREYEGYVARIFQHEIDHLDGVRFPERLPEDGVLHWIEESEIAQYRIHWRDWPKRVPFGKWLEILQS